MDNTGARLYRPLKQPRSEGLWGLTKGTTILAFGLLALCLMGFLLPMPLPFIVIAVCVAVFVPMAMSDGGRSGWERLTMRRQFGKARRRGETIYRSGTFSAIPGVSRLPGIWASSRIYEEVSIGGQPFAAIHTQRRNHWTLVIRVSPRGQDWVDQLTYDTRAGAWGDAIAQIGSATDIVAITAVVETYPDTGQRLRASVEDLIAPAAHPVAAQILREAATVDEDAVRLEARVAITFRADTPLRRRTPQEQIHEIARRVPGIIGILSAAELSPRPMTAGEIVAFTRRAYCPEALRALEESAMNDELGALRWSGAGPVSADEYRDHYLHDGGLSITWEMDGSPMAVVPADTLAPLLRPSSDLPRKRVALIYRPHSAAEAVKVIDGDYTDALTAEAAGRGQVSAAARMRVGLAEAARDEQAQGAGVTLLGVLITITTQVGADMPAIESLTRDMTAASRLSIRRCYGYQAAAFAGGIGAGVVLPEHASVSGKLAG